ncbi:PDZ domain-containing protein [Arthrobacter sp. PAMC25284]|nr:PDZ domain-containing protein [Arthrobacter sp. PAMC25284]
MQAASSVEGTAPVRESGPGGPAAPPRRGPELTITEGGQPASDPAGGPVRGRRGGRTGAWTGRKPDNRSAAMLVSGLLAMALGVTAVSLPVPYVIESPGPTFNTLGEDQGEPVITVTGTESFPAKGSLDLTTVYVDGGPNGPVSVFAAFSAWLNGSKAVYPEELIFPRGVTKEQSQQESSTAMVTSQENAVAAALKELNIPFEQRMEIASLADGSAADGQLQAGDVLLSINDKPITALAVVQAELAAGNGAPVTVVVDRSGSRISATITPSVSPSGRFILGVILQYNFTFPFDVRISLDEVGGPSAGMMFALGIIDTITPGELTGGTHVAGTGTISPDGSVGPIGGISQKMHGARSAGASLFLAPAANCGDVVGHIPDGLQVVKVENLAGARKAVELAASGSDTSGLPACTSG